MEGRTSMLLQVVLKHLPFELNPTSFVSLFSFIIAIVLLIKLQTVTRRNKPDLLPPSPPKFPFIGNLHQLGTLPHRSLTALSRKYGSLMLLRLGQTPTLVVSSAHMAKEITKSHDVVFSDRPQTTAAKILLYGCTDVGFLPYGEEWRLKRKICVLGLLSLKRVQSFQYIREEEVADLVNKIRQACSEHDDHVNISQMVIATSNNIVSRCLLGEKFEAGDGKSSFGNLARKVMVLLAAFSFGNFFPSLRWMDFVTGLIPKLNATFRELDTFFDEVLAQHKAAKRNDDDGHHRSEKKDFVDILHQLQHDDLLDIELNQSDIKAMIMDFFTGGSDTTSTALEWAFAELMRNPRTMKKAQEEVRRMMGKKSKVEETDVRKMKFLECVVKETLRLHPPLPLSVPRETRSGVTLGGYYVPPKTTVFMNAWAIQRDPEFWERPEEFVPERFENSNVDFKGQDFELIPFGSGRRGCPGLSFGIASLDYVLANLLYWFDWKLPTEASKSTQQAIDMSEIFGLTVVKKQPICVQPIPYLI
ncbi:phenylacetaldehyde oxime monooxygenase CYP71AN24-like [Prosopis cineraria]|uniref:phenylacetaldehyde oxime monooxygenase CYP71AN24-like n=1 Tax=Prosopis cineraria TaxID=364024 RepID=UPI00240F4355|nr:phenylacetaldehyde oxime monooxygenase CYP71AN24-like [Prosopis cineraria]